MSVLLIVSGLGLVLLPGSLSQPRPSTRPLDLVLDMSGCPCWRDVDD